MAVDIVAENAKTAGVTSHTETALSGYGDITVAGFARQPSVNVGETINFSIDGGATTVDIYRVGYYGGNGWRLVDTISNTPTTQPEAQTIPNSNGATTCTNWSITASWPVPLDATSGLYCALIRSVAPQAPNGFWAMFVVRDDDAVADIIYKTSDSTWGAAYNHYGTKSNVDGKNIYGSGVAIGNSLDRSLAVDFHRPNLVRDGVATYWQRCEQPMIRFLERFGYTVKYISSVDLDRDPTILDNGTIFLSSGHDEYWSANMRNNVKNWRDGIKAGRSIFMSGNEVFWKTEFAYSGDRVTMWCRKDTMDGPTAIRSGGGGTPIVPGEWQGTWKDTRWPGKQPEWLLTGTDFRMNGIYQHNATILSSEVGTHPAWVNTTVSSGSNLTLSNVIGFEADEMRPTQPAGSYKVLAGTDVSITGYFADDNGQNYNLSGVLDWGIVSQRYASGAVTVGFGTCQWSWALDDFKAEVNQQAQQFTVNLLNDLGAAPATLPSPLVTTAPHSLDEYGVVPTVPVNHITDSSGNILTPYTLSGGVPQEMTLNFYQSGP